MIVQSDFDMEYEEFLKKLCDGKKLTVTLLLENCPRQDTDDVKQNEKN